MSSPREEAVLYWWNRAWEALRAAKRDFQVDAYPFAINRLYYAIFYAASAQSLRDNDGEAEATSSTSRAPARPCPCSTTSFHTTGGMSTSS